MSEWKRIDSIADVRRGASPRPIGDPKYFGGEVGWVRISDVTRSSRFLRETEQYLSPTGEALSVRVNSGDLVMSICGTLGRPIIIDMAACIHDGFVQFTNLRDADTTYLFYALQFAESAFCGMGQPGTQTNLNTSLVGRHTIFCPTLSEQRRIAEILSTLDETIEQTDALIAKMQQVKAGLMHDLFTHGVTPDCHLRPTREQAPDLYKESPLGWIPKEWETATTGTLCTSIVPGRNKPYLDGGVFPWITITDLAGAKITESLDGLAVSARSLKSASGRTVPTGSVIMSCVGEFGIVAIAGCELVINQQLHGLVPNGKLCPEWLMHSLKLQGPYMERIATQTTIKYLNKAGCESVLVAVPPLEEQRLILSRIDSIEEIENSELQLSLKLRQQKHGLMHDLLTGQVCTMSQ